MVVARSFLIHALVLRGLGKITATALDAVRRDVQARGLSAQDAAVLVEEAVARYGVDKSVADEVYAGLTAAYSGAR